MKNLILIAGIIISTLSLLSFSTGLKETSITKSGFLNEKGPEFIVPENVQAVLDKSCLPCHGADGSGKAKMKWNYEKMAGLKPSKMVGKLSKIVSKVKAGKMPPAKFIGRNPDKKLTDDDKNTLIDWADGLTDELVK